MTIDDLVAMCRSRLAQLSQLRSSAVALGDVEQVSKIDAQASETQATLNQLLTLV